MSVAGTPTGTAIGLSHQEAASLLTNPNLARTAPAVVQFLWITLKEDRGQPISAERLDRLERAQARATRPSPAPLRLPSDRRSPAEHAASARRNPLARLFGARAREAQQ